MQDTIQSKQQAALELFSHNASKGSVQVFAPPTHRSRLLNAVINLTLVAIIAVTSVVNPAFAATKDVNMLSESPITLSINGVQTNYLSNTASIQVSKNVAKEVGLKTGWRALHAITAEEHGWSLESLAKCFPNAGNSTTTQGIKGLVTAVAKEIKQAETWVANNTKFDLKDTNQTILNGLNKDYVESLSTHYHEQIKSCENSVLRDSSAADIKDSILNNSDQKKTEIDHIRAMTVKSEVESENKVNSPDFEHIGKFEGINITLLKSEKAPIAIALLDKNEIQFSKTVFDSFEAKLGSSQRTKEMIGKNMLWHEAAHINEQPSIPAELRSSLVADMENIADASSTIRLLQDGFTVSEVLSLHVAFDSANRSNITGSSYYELGAVKSGYIANDTAMLNLLTQNKSVFEIIKDASTMRQNSIANIKLAIEQDLVSKQMEDSQDDSQSEQISASLEAPQKAEHGFIERVKARLVESRDVTYSSDNGGLNSNYARDR